MGSSENDGVRVHGDGDEPAADSAPSGGDPGAWLSTAEAAERLGVTPRTLYRFIDEGQVPAYRFGRVIRLRQGEVDAFIEACRIAPGSLVHLYPDTVDVTD